MTGFNIFLSVWWVILIILIGWLFLKPADAQEVFPGFGIEEPVPPRHRYEGHYRKGDCEELRRACMYKEELGEVGAGNCQRYRQTCGWE